jgi:two-component system, chemotaxis family, protein-glutamate methylesterase/glutaminase
MPGHDIITVGASAGGVNALVKLVGQLPADLAASVFIVLHIPAQSPSHLPDILSRSGPLLAIHPTDGEEIKHGRICIAPPDQHLLIEDGHVRVVQGPRENRHRPAIDPLFRSAALAYGPRVVAVILTGALDDGTAGLLAVKRRGGIAVVQDPHDALYPSMPLSALTHVRVDHILPLYEIGPLLIRLVGEQAKEEGAYPVPDDMQRETKLIEMDTSIDMLSSNNRVGTPSAFSCPECGGVLWELHDGELLRYRCRVGHAFSIDSVLAAQTEQAETALWEALKSLQENASLSRQLAERAREHGQIGLARNYEEKLRDAEHRALFLQEILRKSNLNHTTNASADQPG